MSRRNAIRIVILSLVLLTFLCACAGALADGVPVKSLKILTKANTAVKAGDTLAIEYAITPEDATDKSLTWQSSDEAVATVDANGVVTALSAGKVTISAVTNDGSKKQAKVNLYIPSLYCETTQLDLTDPAGADFTLDYFGTDWENDVTVKITGKAFSYKITREGTKVIVHVDGETAGNGKIDISDKKDKAGKVTVKVNVAQSAIPLSKELYIEKVDWKNTKGRFTIRNNTGDNVYGVSIACKYFNQDGELLFCTEEGFDGVGKELSFYNKDSRNKKTGEMDIRKGQTYHLKVHTTHYPDTVRAEFAIYHYTKEDGTFVSIADNGLHWFDSETQTYLNAPELMNVNCWPGKEALERSNTLDLGYKESRVREWQAPHWGFHHGGWFIEEVDEGSIAEKAGLQVHDLIIAIDETLLANDRYIIEKGKLKLLDGQPITVTIERPGTEGTIDLIFEPETPAAKTE